MGSAASKPESKVFTPQAPVDLSASFLAHLENTLESDYTRAQYTEKYIQERVAKELARFEAEAIELFKKTTNDSLLPADNSNVSVSASNDKLSELSQNLQKSAELLHFVLPESLKEAKALVLLCLKDNAGKPLNCWDEVVEFKKLVHSSRTGA